MSEPRCRKCGTAVWKAGKLCHTCRSSLYPPKIMDTDKTEEDGDVVQPSKAPNEFQEALAAAFEGQPITPDKVMRFIVAQLNHQIMLWQKKCFECVVPPDRRRDIAQTLKRFGASANTAKFGWETSHMIETISKEGARSLLVIPGDLSPLQVGAQLRKMEWQPVKSSPPKLISEMRIDVSSHNPINITFTFPEHVYWPGFCPECGGWATVNDESGNRIQCPFCQNGQKK